MTGGSGKVTGRTPKYRVRKHHHQPGKSLGQFPGIDVMIAKAAAELQRRKPPEPQLPTLAQRYDADEELQRLLSERETERRAVAKHRARRDKLTKAIQQRRRSIREGT